MKAKMILFLLVLTLAAVSAQSTSQQEEEGVRGAFLTTRPKQVDKPAGNSTAAKPIRRRRKTLDSGKPIPISTPNPGQKSGQRIGLGLTLFTRDSNGLALRSDPNRVFRKGDRVRVLLETNADGYLYIFNTTDGGKPVMIYPDAQLDDAGNYIQSHVPFEIPSSVAAEERLRWFSFDEQPGAERLFFVFTREPLPAVPIDDDLLNYCRGTRNKCPWQPGVEVWAQIQKELSAPVQVDKSQQYGNAQSASEQSGSTRGIGLSREDPEPSLVMLTASSNTPILVATLELIHR
jgi:hypothetical protein